MHIRSKLEVALRRLAQVRSSRRLRQRPELWSALQDYLAKTQSTGCGYIDYSTLYESVRTAKPVEVLECGTGVSTLVIAHALMENEIETGRRGRVTSMEEHENWLDMSRQLLPDRYLGFVDFRLSDVVEDRFSIFRGVRYKDVPDRAFDFVFVDGPKYVSPVDGELTFDFDYLHVLRQADHCVQALIDKRVSTVFVLQQLLGPDKVTYSKVNGLGYVKPCTKHDLGSIRSSLSSTSFEKSMRVVGSSRLSITSNT
jgi:predicted O-methyltransferase YrrM